MKAILLVFLVFAVFSRTSPAADPAAPAKQKFTLVKLVDREDKETYQVLEAAQLTALQEEIKKEERYFDKAMMMAEKAWKADESTKTKSFPRSAIGHRSCTVVNNYLKREDADKALSAAEDKVSRAEENRIEAEKKREETRRKMGQNNNSSYVQKRKDTRIAEAERRGIEDQARNLFTTKLEELKAGKPEVKEPAAAGAPADEKNADPKAPAAGAGAAKH